MKVGKRKFEITLFTYYVNNIGAEGAQIMLTVNRGDEENY